MYENPAQENEVRLRCPICQSMKEPSSPIMKLFASQKTYTEQGLRLHVKRRHPSNETSDTQPSTPDQSQRRRLCRTCNKMVTPEVFQRGRYVMARCPTCGREWIAKRWPEIVHS